MRSVIDSTTFWTGYFRRVPIVLVTLLLMALLLVGCGNSRSGPGYSMIFPEETATPVPLKSIAAFHEESLATITNGQEDKVIAATVAENQSLFVALAQSGLWMAVEDGAGSYVWSRPQALPDLLTTNEISTLDIYKGELRVGTHNHGLFRLSLTSGNSDWHNDTTENSALPSNSVNRISQDAVMTTKGVVVPGEGGADWLIYDKSDGLLDENTLDMGKWFTYANGGTIIAAESGLVQSDAKSNFARFSGGSRCHFEHASRIYTVGNSVLVMIDQKDVTSSSGWRPVGICKGRFFITMQWDPIFLDTVAFPNAQISAHFQDASERVWILFSRDATHPQGSLASYSYSQDAWVRYPLPTGMPDFGADATMLLVNNDLWVENAQTSAFTVLENVVAE